MKKKTKVIVGSTAILSIASIVIGCSLACVQYNKPTKSATTTKKDAVNLAAKNQTPILASNDVHNLNDNAYLKTINQSGTINPLGKKWTKTTALKYYTNLLDSNIKIFGITSILRWSLIQNFNYQINELQSTFTNNTNFNLNVNHFNYIIFKTNNNDTKLSDYLCNITFNFTATITSKKNSNATFSFSCQYTYKNVKVNAIIHNISNNGYGYFELTNTTANTLVPSSATYFDHASISSAWTNDDFNDLIASGYLPTTGNQTINTNNYHTVLPADCARALALLTNNTQNNLTNNQQIVISPVNFLQLYTFNIGLKFNDLNDLVIMPLVSANTSDGNMYTYSYNAVVSLGVNLALSTIDPNTNHDLKYMWQYSNVTNPNWKNDTSVSALTSTLTFNANENYMYRLIVTKPDGTKLTSNSIIINVVGNNLSIISGNTPSTNNTYTYSFGTQTTLSINTKEWTNPNLGLIYTWQVFDNNTGEWQQLASSSKDDTYSVNVLQSDTYRLIITQKNNPAFNLISNTVLLNVVDNTLNITSNATNPLAIIYGNKVTFSITTKIWQKNPDVNYQWYEVKNGETNKIGANTDTYTTSVTSSASYYLVITHNPSIKGFKLTSNSIQVGTTDNSLNIEIKKQPVNNNNIYSFTYWTPIDLIISSSHWSDASNPHSDVYNPDLVYTWCKFDATTNKYKPISNPNNYNYLYFNLTDNGSYELQITTKEGSPDYNPDFLLTSNPVQINVTDKYVNIAASSDNVSLAGNEITPTYGSSVTLQVSAPSIWVDNQSLTYQWYKIGQTTPIYEGSTYKFNVSGKATYYLKITNKDGFSLTSTNQISINPQIPSLNIEVEKNSNSKNGTYSFTYGTSVTLGIAPDTFWSNTSHPGYTYQWKYFSNTSNQFENATPPENVAPNGPSPTYPFNCFSSTSYELVISFNGNQIPSNIININVLDSTLQIGVVKDQSVIATNNTYSEIYGNSVTLGIVTPSWRNPTSSFKVTYQWQKWDSKTGGWTNVGTDSNTFTTNPLVETEKYRLEITDTGISGFALPPSASLTINLTHNTLAIKPTYIQGQGNVSVATNNTYQITYGSYTTLGINDNNYWFNPSSSPTVSKDLVYQWYSYDVVKGGFVPISQANTKTYSFYAHTNTQYELVITTNQNSSGYISGFNLTSSPITVNIINQTATIDLSVPGTTQTVSGNDTYNVTYGASPTLSLSGYWATQTTFTYLTYQWYKFDPTTSGWKKVPDATTDKLTLQMIQTSGTYKLVISAKQHVDPNKEQYPDFSLTSNNIIVNVINATLQIGIGETSLNTYNVVYGTGLTLGITTAYYKNSKDLTYKWEIYNTTTNKWDKIAITPTCHLNAFENGQYQLVITSTSLGFSLTSNTLNLNVNDSTIDIVAAIDKQSAPTTVKASYNVPYASTTTLSIISTNYWAQNPTGLTYQWYSINANGQPSEITGAKSATYSFNPLLSGSYQLVVINSNITGFRIPSNIITINVIDSNIAIGINNNEVSTYSTSFGKQVTLSLLSDYWKNTQDVTFQWQYLDNGTWTNVVAPTDAPPSISGRSYNYTFTASSSVSYQLIVTTYNPTDGKSYPPLTSNSINVMVSDTTLMITSDKNTDATNNIKSGVVDVNYGGSITFSIDTPYWKEMTTGVTYHWEISTDNGNSYNPITNDAAKRVPYMTTIFKDEAYRLMLTINNETLISNQIFVRVINNTVTIATTTGSNDVNYASSVTLTPNSYWVNNQSNYVFTWYKTSDPSKPVYVGNGIATYTFNGFTNQIYYVEVTSKSNETEYKTEFGTLPSNYLSIIIQNTTSKINIQGQTNTNNSNSYNITYGQSITLQIDPTDYWAGAIKDSKDYSFQWEIWNGTTYAPVDSNTTPSSTPSTTNGLASTYYFTAISNGQYILKIKNTSIPGFDTLWSNAIVVNVVNSTVQIAYKQNSSNPIPSSYDVNCGTLVTLDISDNTSYWSTVSTSDYTFTWQVWDASHSKFTTAPKSADPTSPMIYSTYVLLESNMYRLEIKEPNNPSFVPIYSNNITFNPLNSTLTITPTTVTTAATGNSYNVVYGTTSYSLGINTEYWKKFSGLHYQWYQWNSQASKFDPITTSGLNPTFDPSTLVSGTYQLEITDSAIGLTLKSNELTLNIVDNSYSIAPTINAQPNVNTYSVSWGDSMTLGISPSSFWNGKSGNTYQWEYLYNGTWYTIEQMHTKNPNWNASYSGTNNGTNATYTITVDNDTQGAYRLVLSSTGTYSFSNLESSNNIYVAVINTNLEIVPNNEAVSINSTYKVNYGTSTTLAISKSNYYATASGWTYQWLYFNGNEFVPISGEKKPTYHFNALVSYSYELKITNANGTSLTSSPINIDVLNASVNILASAPYGSSTGSATPWSNNSAYVPYTSPLQLKLDSDYWYNQLTNTELTYTIYDDTTQVASWTSTSGQILTINDILASGTYKLVIANPNIKEILPNGDTQDFNVSSNIIAVTVTETSVALQGSCAQNIANATTTPSNGIIDISYWATANINIQLGSYWATQINNSKYSFELWNQTTNQKINGVSGPTLMNGVQTFQISQFTSPMALQLRIYEVGTNNYIPSNILQLKVVNNDFYLKTNAIGATYNSETETWTIPIYQQTSSISIDVAPTSSSAPSLADAFNWMSSGRFNLGVVYYQYDSTSQTWTGLGGGGIGPTPAPYQNSTTVPLTSGKDILTRYKAEIVLVNSFNNQIVNNGFSINVPITIFDNVGKTFNWQLTTNANVTQVSSATYQVNPNTPLTFSTAFTENFLSNYESNGQVGGNMFLQQDINGTWTTVISDQRGAFASEYQNNGFYPIYNSSESWNIETQSTYEWSIIDTSNWRLMWWYYPMNSTGVQALYYSEPITIIVNKPTLPIQIENANSQIVKSVDNIYFLNPSTTYNLSINMNDSNIDFPGYSGTINDSTPYITQGYVYIATYEWQKAIIQSNGTLGSWTNLPGDKASFIDSWYNPSGSSDYDKFEELYNQFQNGTTYKLPAIVYNDLTIGETAMYKLTVLMAGTTMIGNWSSNNNPTTVNVTFGEGQIFTYVVPHIAFTMDVQSTFVVVPTTTASTKNSSSTNSSISLLNYLTVNKNYQ